MALVATEPTIPNTAGSVANKKPTGLCVLLDSLSWRLTGHSIDLGLPMLEKRSLDEIFSPMPKAKRAITAAQFPSPATLLN